MLDVKDQTGPQKCEEKAKELYKLIHPDKVAQKCKSEDFKLKAQFENFKLKFDIVENEIYSE